MLLDTVSKSLLTSFKSSYRFPMAVVLPYTVDLMVSVICSVALGAKITGTIAVSTKATVPEVEVTLTNWIIKCAIGEGYIW